jgi:hypothetical protein
VKFDCSQHCDWLYPFPSAKLDILPGEQPAAEHGSNPRTPLVRNVTPHPKHDLLLPRGGGGANVTNKRVKIHFYTDIGNAINYTANLQ